MKDDSLFNLKEYSVYSEACPYKRVIWIMAANPMQASITENEMKHKIRGYSVISESDMSKRRLINIIASSIKSSSKICLLFIENFNTIRRISINARLISLTYAGIVKQFMANLHIKMLRIELN